MQRQLHAPHGISIWQEERTGLIQAVQVEQVIDVFDVFFIN